MKASSVISLVVAFSVVLLSSGALAGPPPSGYRMLKKIPISAAPGGAEYFDYITVDATARRVYVSHGTVVNVLDADNGSMIGTVAGLQRCHGVALVDELGEGRAVPLMRKHVALYLKGIAGSAQLRAQIMTIDSCDSVVAVLESKIDELESTALAVA